MTISKNLNSAARIPRKFHINDRVGNFNKIAARVGLTNDPQMKLLVDELQKAFDQMAEENRQNWLEIERYLSDLMNKFDFRPEVTASYFGTPTVATSPPYRWRYDVYVGEATASLGTAGSTNTTIDVKKNGTTLQTITLGNGVSTASVAINTAFTADTDVLTFAITAVGTGAQNLTCKAHGV